MATDINIKEEPDVPLNLKINKVVKDPAKEQNSPKKSVVSNPPCGYETIVIKLEPVSHVDCNIEYAAEIPREPVIVKLEKQYHESDDEFASTSNTYKIQKDDSDEEYLPPNKTANKDGHKKKQTSVKPLFKGKPKKTDNMLYSDESTKHIEIVTITELERYIEHRDLLNARLHMRYVCSWCALGFVVEDAYRDHMKIHLPEKGDYECDICHSRLKSADVLYRHKLRHFRRYRCMLCEMLLRDKDTAAAHVTDVHLGAAFACAHCDKSFKRPQYLKRHVDQMHTKPVELECPVCKRVFHEKGWYRCHVRTHNEEVRQGCVQLVTCYHCGRDFKNKTNLRRHLDVHERHRTDCLQCGSVFKNNEALRRHCRNQHPDRPLPRPLPDTSCNQCERVCATPAMLARHQRRMHSDRTKRFECAHCGRYYLTKGEVRSHIMWSHMRRLGGHVCGCGRVFRSPARLRRHEAKDHLRLPEPRDKFCPVCGKAFANQQVLTRHIKGHNGDLYPCTECGRAFKTQSYVKIHYKLQHLNMTRAQIKAETRRKLLTVETMGEGTEPRAKMIQKRMKSKKLVKEPPPFEEVQIKEETAEVINAQIPLFETFVDIQRQ